MSALKTWRRQEGTTGKYAGIKERFKSKGYQTSINAFIVGSLGTWDPENDHFSLPWKLVGSTEPCSKSSVAVTPSPAVTRCGPPVVGGSSSSRVPAKSNCSKKPALTLARCLVPSWPLTHNPPVKRWVRPPSARVTWASCGPGWAPFIVRSPTSPMKEEVTLFLLV